MFVDQLNARQLPLLLLFPKYLNGMSTVPRYALVAGSIVCWGPLKKLAAAATSQINLVKAWGLLFRHTGKLRKSAGILEILQILGGFILGGFIRY